MAIKQAVKDTSGRVKSRASMSGRTGKALAEERTGTSLGSDDRAQGAMANRAVNIVVGLTVGGLVAAFLLPIAIDEIVAVDTSSWGSGASSLWDILDVIMVLAVFLFFIGIALLRQN